ncbi:MAG: ATP phosphoribosyltransferase [Hyphomicrobiaceae bacterium]
MSDAQSDRLVLAVPSKGRLMDDTLGLFAKAGLTIRKVGNERGYRGEVAEVPAIEVAFISASEIAHAIRDGKVHLGVTGEDLLRETIPDMEAKAQILAPLGFGHADVIVAVPNFWIDVVSMADLEEAAVLYRRRHGTRMRVATKYMGLTRRFFAGHRFDAAVKTGAAVTMYRIVESLGATEGAPAAGTAELIVDITSTGSTLKANGLRILADGVILKSQANLVLSRTASWSPQQSRLRDDIVRALGA